MKPEPVTRTLLRFFISLVLCLFGVLAFILVVTGVAHWTFDQLMDVGTTRCLEPDLFTCRDEVPSPN